MARKRRRPLTDEEIGKQSGTELPRREALSLVFANVAAPANLAAALSPASSQSAAASNAEPAAPVEQ
ncbi:MAG TPA: hypothetical protein VG370_02790 [Chloroflexota bacterium]|jgi:hypothetical protein|nr:hypothetical protein [Chloroflexota bacterium]